MQLFAVANFRKMATEKENIFPAHIAGFADIVAKFLKSREDPDDYYTGGPSKEFLRRVRTYH